MDKTRIKPTLTAQKRQGFTLIELLVVIAIIALLLAIIMPSLRMVKEQARKVICATHLKSIGQAIALYAQQENDELPMNFYQEDPGRLTMATPVACYFFGSYNDSLTDNSTPNERLKNMLGKDSIGGGAVKNLGYLVSANVIESLPEIFYCGSNKSDQYSFKAYGGKDGWPLGQESISKDNPTSIRISYQYLPQASGKKHPSLADYPYAAYKLANANPNLSMAMDNIMNPDMSHKMGGYVGVNILYSGGNVEFSRDSDNVIIENSPNRDGNYMDGSDAAAKGFRKTIRELE